LRREEKVAAQGRGEKSSIFSLFYLYLEKNAMQRKREASGRETSNLFN
jgi:hypothetical protein